MDNKENKDTLGNLDEFNKKYSHYLNENEEADEAPVLEAAEEISVEERVVEEEFIAEEQEPREKKKKKSDKKENFFTRNNKRNTKIIALSLVIVLLLCAAGFMVWIYLSTQSDGYEDNGIDYNEIPSDSDYLSDDDTQFEVMGDIDADSLNGFLYSWANNGGEKMYNKNVINVLLCGVDSVYNLCDSQILVSIDKKNEKITMVSFLRDSWTYIRMPRSDGSYYDAYEKINAAYHGGPTTLKQTIENNYKIQIDEYIVVDFNSFPKVIDAVGGVTVDIQEYETNYIRRTSSQKDFPYGTATLNGKQALIYSRIRHCDSDSDLSRTRRQRSVIKALIASAKTATKGQLVNAFKQVSPYLRTGYSQSEVLSLIATAYSHDWMNFEITEYTMPNEDYVDRLGGYINSSTWAWTVDYPLCAQKLQNLLYGKTNIELSDDRVSALDFTSNHKNTTSADNNNTGVTVPSTTQSPTYYYEPATDVTSVEEPVTEEPIVTEPIREETPTSENQNVEEDPQNPANGNRFSFWQ